MKHWIVVVKCTTNNNITINYYRYHFILCCTIVFITQIIVSISALYFPMWNYSFPFEKYTSINEYIFRYWKLWRNFKSLKLLRKLVVDHYLFWTQWIFSQDMSSCLPTASLLSFWKWSIFNISNSNLLLWVLIFKL